MALQKTFSFHYSIVVQIGYSTILVFPKHLPPSSHTCLAQSHSWKRCSVVSSAILHMTQMEGLIIPRLHRFYQVRTLFLNKSQMKRAIFGHSPWLHNLTQHFSEGVLEAPLIRSEASLTLKVPMVRYPHRSLSGPFRRSIFLRCSS